jgi:hypothetical protein
MLQRLIGNRATGRLLGTQSVQDVIGSPGEELEPATRSSMERRFGTSFSDVRIHDNDEAAASAEALNAEAYTTGTHIVFSDGLYAPDSAEGQRTLAHELAHVMQQRNGPVSGMAIGDGLSVSEPDDAFEKAAEDRAREVMAASPEPVETDAGAGMLGTDQSSQGNAAILGSQPSGTPTALQRRVVCPPGVDPEEGTGCYETADDQSTAPPADSGPSSQEQPNFTPAPGGYSSDPMQGGSSQAPAQDEGGFTPVPGATSNDPL